MQPSDGAHVVVATQGSWDELVTLDALCRSRGTHFIAAVSFAEAYRFRSLEQQQFSITFPHVQGKGHVGKVACRVEFLGNKKMHIKNERRCLKRLASGRCALHGVCGTIQGIGQLSCPINRYTF